MPEGERGEEERGGEKGREEMDLVEHRLWCRLQALPSTRHPALAAFVWTLSGLRAPAPGPCTRHFSCSSWSQKPVLPRKACLQQAWLAPLFCAHRTHSVCGPQSPAVWLLGPWTNKNRGPDRDCSSLLSPKSPASSAGAGKYCL